MKNGIARFDFYLNQMQVLLDKSSHEKNPALWLYQNNLRTPLFMVEALAKMYAGIHNKKKFGKLKEQFKILEDALGGVDYYDAFAKEFTENKKIPEAITGYLQAQVREKMQSLNEVLTEKGWLGTGNKRIIKIRTKLNECDWLNDDAEIKEINEFYGQAIYEIAEFMEECKGHFDNIEADIHELRRKLRWLSIYPQALRGCIQLTKAGSLPGYLKKYLTPAITSSAFNIMPDAAGNKRFLLLEKNHFYALSWMIAELGKIKDNGLRVMAIKEALQQTATLTDAEAYRKTYALLGKDQPRLTQLLTTAEDICKRYFKEHNLEKLVSGIAVVK